MPETIAVFDTETTGLLPRRGSDLTLYPHMAEIYVAKIDFETDEIIAEFESLLKIPVPMPEKLTKHVHGISDEMLMDQPTFVDVWVDIARVFWEADVMVAANLMFDYEVVSAELRRIGQEEFPWPERRFCTIEQSLHLTGKKLKNSVLYEMATGKKLEGIHRAKVDALGTYENYKWLRKNKCT